eukprot:Blabericola_migrator_1__2666@NODE_1756_length_3845_cov_42_863420_g1133_i0_p2_GENE_NODE_1756_length_3845_cov_42_863420_g1133_i0NODE_1756_length_3845_cov_42_863420_g1133_i0_p2_ORF_typecomplete_len142_score18_28_NODE_1756_length_3845_cov_42_863420_g1133_i031683593
MLCLLGKTDLSSSNLTNPGLKFRDLNPGTYIRVKILAPPVSSILDLVFTEAETKDQISILSETCYGSYLDQREWTPNLVLALKEPYMLAKSFLCVLSQANIIKIPVLTVEAPEVLSLVAVSAFAGSGVVGVARLKVQKPNL